MAGLWAGLTVGGDAIAQEPAEQGEGSCVSCHRALEGRLGAPAQDPNADMHMEQGFGCVACHGGDEQEFGMGAMDPDRGYIGVPSPRQILSVCGRCHSDAEFMRRFDPSLRVDQVAEYRTSVHGQRLLDDDDPRVATCADCHVAHAIKPPSDPNSSIHPLNVAQTCAECHADPEYMSSYPIPTDQYDRYTESVHWEMLSDQGDLSAPTCNDCHGNHGATPPGVSWIGNVCGQCHSRMAELFDDSFHSRILAILGQPGCSTCHANHAVERASDQLLGVGDAAACGQCHSEADAGGQVATRMRSLIDSLQTRYDEADSILAQAENAGMEVSEAQFQLNEATTALVSARTAVHSFVVDSVAGTVAQGLEVTSAAHSRGQQALEEVEFRRLGLAVSVIVIIGLIVGVVLKIRQLEGRRTAA